MPFIWLKHSIKNSQRLFICRPIFANNIWIMKKYSSKVQYLDHFRRTQSDLQDVITMQQVNEHTMKEMGIEPGYTVQLKPRDHLLAFLPQSQEELPKRNMKDSLLSAVIPLSKDVALQEKYVSVHGRVRLGRLMEDLDAFAAAVVFQYLLYPKRKPEDRIPYVIVGVLFDQISFTGLYPKHQENIYLTGYVSWTGSTSIEVTVRIEQVYENELQLITQAVLLMAARNSTNTGPAFVNPLVPENEAEAQSLLQAEARKNKRRSSGKDSLLKILPTEEEMAVVHSLFQKSIDLRDPVIHKLNLPENGIWMQDAVYHNIFSGYPENRNMHYKVFGGYMMRHALSLSWYATMLYSQQQRPRLLHISDIIFKNPVNIGSIINMHAHIIYTEKNYVEVAVFADTYVSIEKTAINSNSFYFTYALKDDAKQLFPHSYQDAMMYIDGRRHFHAVMDYASDKY